MGNEKEILDVKLLKNKSNNQQRNKIIEQGNQQELALKLKEAENTNDLFAKKQLRKQQLKLQINNDRKELRFLEGELDIMANEIKAKQCSKISKH